MREEIACIANFSEGRDEGLIAKLGETIASVPGAYLLDSQQDADHHRCVLTFIAPPAAAAEAAFRAIQLAAEQIDLRRHHGEHPRIGAADVIPFVPIDPKQMSICVSTARQLAKRVGGELKMPTYCYGEAAYRNERRHLEAIRRGQYEGLLESILSDPERAPDFGPAKLGPAGAVAIGARRPLIAFNVYLTSADRRLSQRIARRIRASSGGLKAVKALGLFVNGRAQVSMNLTNYQKTGITEVIAAIKREAKREGADIDQSELIGLLPRDAILESARSAWYLLQLDEQHILENRIAAALGGDSEKNNFLEQLAAPTVSPAGVAAAAQTAAQAAALVEMIAHIAVASTRHTEEEEIEEYVAAARDFQERFSNLANDDARAYRHFIVARQSGLPFQSEARAITEIPLHCASLTAGLVALLKKVGELATPQTRPDAATAAELARATLRSSAHALRANLPLLVDSELRTHYQQELTKHENALESSYTAVMASLAN